MDKYGFSLVTREEAKYMGLPEGSGMFSELFNSMQNEIQKNPKKASDYKDAPSMKSYEKNISFLNRFFVYKKTSTRNAEKLTRTLLDQLPDEIAFEQAESMLAREAVKEAEALIKPRAKKLKERLNLQEATEALEEQKAKPKTRTKKAKPEIVEENMGEIEIIEGTNKMEEPQVKKKKTRKAKVVDLVIEGEEEV
jgi:hypothetical protein